MVYRRYRRSRARAYRRYRRSSFNRARRSGQFAAMQQQRDLAKFCLKYRREIEVDVSPQDPVSTGSAAINAMEVLSQVPQYTYLAGLFDECRIAGIRLKLIPTFQVSVNDSSRITQVTAWDRNGTRHQGYRPSYEEICTYGSSYKQSATAFAKNSVTSSIYATDLAERTTYIATGQIAEAINAESLYARAFNPVFLIGVQLPAKPPQTQAYHYEAEIAFDLVFRGTRYDNGGAN